MDIEIGWDELVNEADNNEDIKQEDILIENNMAVDDEKKIDPDKNNNNNQEHKHKKKKTKIKIKTKIKKKKMRNGILLEISLYLFMH